MPKYYLTIDDLLNLMEPVWCFGEPPAKHVVAKRRPAKKRLSAYEKRKKAKKMEMKHKIE